ncbi:MAG: hypothetical protein KDK39_07185 [Leptospiraceae bacterium]|nr:hypothetical protein [Leptospiraceae bacterium]
MPNIQIWTAQGGRFGSGHYQRMQRLAGILQGRSWPVSLIDLSDSMQGLSTAMNAVQQGQGVLLETDSFLRVLLAGRPEQQDELLIIDLRDLAIPVLLKLIQVAGGREPAILSLDNQHPLRYSAKTDERVLYYDTLPHPDLKPDQWVSNLWVNEEALQARLTQKKTGNSDRLESGSKIFCYSGPFVVGAIAGIVSSLAKEIRSSRDADHNRLELVHCGREALQNHLTAAISYIHFDSMEQSEFYHHLFDCDLFLSYFGISMLEAWYVGQPCAFIPVPSPEHELLARYLSDYSGIPILDAQVLAADRNKTRPVGQPARSDISGGVFDRFQTVTKFPAYGAEKKLIQQIEDLADVFFH